MTLSRPAAENPFLSKEIAAPSNDWCLPPEPVPLKFGPTLYFHYCWARGFVFLPLLYLLPQSFNLSIQNHGLCLSFKSCRLSFNLALKILKVSWSRRFQFACVPYMFGQWVWQSGKRAGSPTLHFIHLFHLYEGWQTFSKAAMVPRFTKFRHANCSKTVPFSRQVLEQVLDWQKWSESVWLLGELTRIAVGESNQQFCRWE